MQVKGIGGRLGPYKFISACTMQVSNSVLSPNSKVVECTVHLTFGHCLDLLEWCFKTVPRCPHPHPSSLISLEDKSYMTPDPHNLVRLN